MPGQDTQDMPVENGAFGQQTNGQPRLPSTRDWVKLRQNALESAGRLGPDEAAKMMDKIDELQRTNAKRNLQIARELVTQGRQEEAGKYIEAANSYMGNMTSVITSPAKLRDGSTQTAMELRDEQTGEPVAPAMFATLPVIDRMLLMAEEPEKYGQKLWDREMAEKKFGYTQGRADRSDFESDRAYGRQTRRDEVGDYQWGAGHNLDVAKAQQTTQGKPIRYKAGDYDRAVDARLKRIPVDPATGNPNISEQQLRDIDKKMAEARREPALSNVPPDVMASRIIERVMSAKPNVGNN
jgi:hypothetical protein